MQSYATFSKPSEADIVKSFKQMILKIHTSSVALLWSIFNCTFESDKFGLIQTADKMRALKFWKGFVSIKFTP